MRALATLPVRIAISVADTAPSSALMLVSAPLWRSCSVSSVLSSARTCPHECVGKQTLNSFRLLRSSRFGVPVRRSSLCVADVHRRRGYRNRAFGYAVAFVLELIDAYFGFGGRCLCLLDASMSAIQRRVSRLIFMRPEFSLSPAAHLLPDERHDTRVTSNRRHSTGRHNQRAYRVVRRKGEQLLLL